MADIQAGLTDAEMAQMGATPVPPSGTPTVAPPTPDPSAGLTDEDMARMGATPAPAPATPAPADPGAGLTDEEMAAAGAEPVEQASAPGEQTGGNSDKATTENPLTKPELMASHVVLPSELTRIAEAHGVDATKLREFAPVFGAVVATDPDDPTHSGYGQLPGAILGHIGGWVTGDAANNLVKRLKADTPEMRAAADDLHELIDNKRGTAEKVLDVGGSVASQIAGFGGIARGVGAATGLAGGALKAAQLGAEATALSGQAAVNAKPDEVLRDVAINLGVLGVFHGAGTLITKARTSAAAKAVEELASSPEIAGAAEEAGRRYTANSATEAALAQGVASGAKSASELAEHLTPEQMEAVAGMTENGGVGHATEQAVAEEAAAAEPTPSDAEAVADGEASADTTDVPPEVRPQSPADMVAAAELGIPPPGTPGDVAARAWDFIQQTRKRLAERVQGDVLDALADPSKGPELVARRLETLRRSDYMLDSLRDAGLDMNTYQGRQIGNMGFVRRVGMFFSDARHVYDAIDNRYGTELTPVLDRISRGYQATTYLAQQAAADRADVVKLTNKLLSSTTASGAKFGDTIWKALDSGHFDASEFSPEQIEVLRGWKKHFAWLADKADNLHVEFPELNLTPVQVTRLATGPEGSYIPHYAMGGAEFVSAMQSEMRDSGLRTGQQIFQAASRKNNRAAGLLRGLELWNGGDITTEMGTQEAIDKMFALERTGEAVNTSARSLFSRTGFIPDFLLVKDPLKLADAWGSGTFRHLMLRDPLAELSTQAGNVLDKVSPHMASYVQNHIKDIAGIRRGTLSAVISDAKEMWKYRCLDAASNATTDAGKGWYRLMSHLDDIGSAWMSNMYSSILGLRPDAAIRYATQPAFFATPQLSAMRPGDAAGRITRAYARAAAELATSPRAATEELMRLGRLPSEQAYEAQRHLSTGLADAGIGKFIAQTQSAADAVNHFAMGMIRASDIMGRLVTKHMAVEIVDDAAHYIAARNSGAPAEAIAQAMSRGESAAVAIHNASPGYRSAIQRALREGDVDGAKDLMTQFMTSHTQFDYNRIAMSNYGRYMGGLFSMFSKWPTSIAGEVLGMADARAIGKPLAGSGGRFLTKYLAPLAATTYLNKAVWEPFQEEQSPASNAARLLVGKNLVPYAPGDTLGDVLRGDFVHKPPGTDILQSLGSGIPNGDPAPLLASLLDNAVNGAPFGAPLKRLLLDWGPSFAGEGAPISLRGLVESGVRDNVVNPGRWALGLDSVETGKPQGH